MSFGASYFSRAQTSDSLWVKMINNKWDVMHHMKEGETIFQLAKIYSVPPAEIAAENGVSYNTRLQPGTLLYIPLGTYNRISKSGVSGTRPLYYKVTANDDWQRMAYLAMTSAEELRRWNAMPLSGLKNGQVLLVGWVRYEPQVLAPPVPVIEILPKTDSSASLDTIQLLPVISQIEEQFNFQTSDGLNVTSEKGAAVYFDSKNSGDTYYAFFNMAPRGTILKIMNPGNGAYVFAKVIGSLPLQDRYQSALIGLSLNAQKVLGGKGSRTWCEVTY